MIWALVPVKRLEAAKSRLAPVLDSAERGRLAKAMLRDVLDTLRRVETLAGILVVTDDAEVAAIAAGHGATVIGDPQEPAFNAAVLHGMHWLDARQKAGALVVPGDIPLVTVEEIEAVLDATRTSPVVIVPATRDGGTNMLAIAPPLLMPPTFGPDSFARHVAAAQALGITPAILRLEGAGHDVDVAADLVLDTGSAAAPRTRALIRQLRGTPVPAVAGSFKEAVLP
ncbi:2-phospho-L-lactate guanylyltransferase [Kaistia sp. 32K]|uniref:2-phospho-L-lactate guanylyltransferase n=1 Tax=Kaistia sp. 32K TaxID=2795690 RepID=UPI00191677F0|nr:2-phospho-L-lactate guanylyltransferase [Kaistia sp. 32K]BCP53013.1 2-phospho-L-lactate guanylyltransferase [Kaistia sp. 32K]